jgi:acetylornithine deacetylase/succinyl-diaminopimelate desuccinylase-like protein
MNERVAGQDLLQAALAEIDEEALIELALDLGNIDSPTGQEGAASDYVFEWLEVAGFEPRRLGLFPDRANVVARLAGRGGGPSLLFNGHLDTTIAKQETLTTPLAGAPEYHQAWRDGDLLIGNGIVNNKGVMATWLTACKALRDADVPLLGDLALTSVVGEIGLEPVDEFQPPEYIAKEAGARYLVNRGVSADYALVAEGTSFNLCWVEAGKAFFKVLVHGDEPPLYTPYLPRPTTIAASPNAIVRSTLVVQAIEEWALEYEREHTYRCAGGTVVPKVSVNAVRSGVPYKITKTPSICHLYLDIRVAPDQTLLSVERELRAALEATGIPVTIEPFVFRRGYEAQNVEPLVAKVEAAHRRVFGETPGRPVEAVTSMWRDSNVFNEAGIPTVVYGPGASVGGGNFAMEITALVQAAKVYTAIAIEVCGIEQANSEEVER